MLCRLTQVRGKAVSAGCACIHRTSVVLASNPATGAQHAPVQHQCEKPEVMCCSCCVCVCVCPAERCGDSAIQHCWICLDKVRVDGCAFSYLGRGECRDSGTGDLALQTPWRCCLQAAGELPGCETQVSASIHISVLPCDVVLLQTECEASHSQVETKDDLNKVECQVQAIAVCCVPQGRVSSDCGTLTNLRQPPVNSRISQDYHQCLVAIGVKRVDALFG